jgi:hypothetical protein
MPLIRIIVNMICFLASFEGYSQYQLGMRLENNSGMYGITINPNQNLFTANKWEIHLGSAGFFLSNNYIFFKETNLSRLIRNRETLRLVDQKLSDKDNVVEVGYSYNSSSRFLQARAFISGPAIAYQIRKNQTLGFFFQARSGLSATNIPNEFSYNKITARKHFEPFKASPFGGAFMNLMEYGINYAVKKEDFYKNSISFGLNLKYLRGYEMLFANSLRTYDHAVIGTNDFSMDRPKMAFGYSSDESIFGQAHGNGGAIDIGISYVKNGKNNDIDYKIGFSLIDLGFVQFNRDITSYRFVTDSTLRVFGKDYENLVASDGIDGVTNLFINNSLAQKGDLSKSNSQRIILPFSMSLQFDYKLKKSIYINALIVQPVTLSDINMHGIHIIALTPRFEERGYSFSLPVSIVEKKAAQIGVAARLGILTLGSDQILSIIRKGNFYGSDIYAGIKLGFGKKDTKDRKRRNDDGCYSF